METSHISPETIYLHFNFNESNQHHLPLKDFIETAKSTEAIIEGFNQKIFGGELKYEVCIYPPDNGSLITTILVCIGTIGAAALWYANFADTTTGKAVIEELTGKTPDQFARSAAKKAKDSTKEIKKTITKFTENFLEKDNKTLRNAGLKQEDFKELYQAKNNFYETCKNNNDIKSLGFDKSDNFPVKRKDFDKFISEITENTEIEEDTQQYHETTHIKATSPNWDKHDKPRGWKGKDKLNKTIYFTIQDEAFWTLQSKGLIKKRNGFDSLKVQWIFSIGENESKVNIKVLKVLEFNGMKISDELTAQEIDAISNPNITEIEELQTSLF